MEDPVNVNCGKNASQWQKMSETNTRRNTLDTWFFVTFWICLRSLENICENGLALA